MAEEVDMGSHAQALLTAREIASGHGSRVKADARPFNPLQNSSSNLTSPSGINFE